MSSQNNFMRKPSQKSSRKSSAAGSLPQALPEGAPPARARRQRGHARVEVLLAAAAEVFAEKGYDAATMTAIAERAASSIGSLYQFFPTKPGVAQALITLQAQALRERLDALARASPGWTLAELAQRLAPALIEFRAAHPSFARLVDTPGAPPALVEAVRLQVRAQVQEVLAPHAAGLGNARLGAVAVAVQQVMKAAVAVNTEGGPGARAALAELKEMLRVYLENALQT